MIVLDAQPAPWTLWHIALAALGGGLSHALGRRVLIEIKLRRNGERRKSAEVSPLQCSAEMVARSVDRLEQRIEVLAHAIREQTRDASRQHTALIEHLAAIRENTRRWTQG